ncbi:tetratricopeptide repeat protein [Thermomonospora cellulosilytica]|uniref:Tetratricopeptide (TPR) repeat protein n=1 Tax=Thermomonospora cellulosilytica TaxID=1411118 RepID=A0A7W3MTX7_9ACTN|nr:tetratricopeptide repeat protein [Thermomonospora cellulosilytica]MBA9001777.1 tetratricopeptide (TPR) repeat protein [Thermomonospora cellulosilytica]
MTDHRVDRTRPRVPVPGGTVEIDAPGAVYLGDTQFEGDAVAGNKIVYMAAEQRRPPAQLPADVQDFTGRRTSLDRLNELAAMDGPRTAVLTAIHGMAGVGKTALAVHWAHQVAGQFPDGQLYVDLRGYSDDAALTPMEALGRFLRALGVPDAAVPDDLDERAALYRSMLSGRRMLVLLDNAADARQVVPLLPGSATCLTVVTSRSQLSSLRVRGGAHTIAIDVLTPEESVDLIASIVGPEPVAAEPEAAAQLALQCAYLPLALRIAAVHVAMGTYSSIAELVEELSAGDRLDTLECDDDPNLAVRAAFGLSYRHLDEPVQRAFRRIGLLEGPDFTPQILAVLLDATAEQVRPLLRVLANANLVQSREGRHRLHDLLREYAWERVDEEETAEERNAALSRLVAWYVDNAHKHGSRINPYRSRLKSPSGGRPPDPGTDGPGDPPPELRHGHPARSRTEDEARDDYRSALDWFEAERMGLVAVTRQAARLGMGRPVWELADAAYDFLRLSRYNRDNTLLQRLGLDAATAAGAAKPRAYVLHHLAALHRDIGGYPEALRFAQRALDACREAGQQETHALHTLRLIGDIHWRMAKYARALDCFAEDLRLCQEAGDKSGEATTLTFIGLVHSNLGRYTEAVEHLRRAVDIERDIGSRRGEGQVLHWLAYVHHSLGHSRKASEYAQLALEAQRDAGYEPGQARTLNLLTQVTHALGDHRQAVRYGEQALAICQAIGDRLGEGRAYDALSMLQRQLGAYRKAEELAKKALKVRREIGDRPGEAFSLEALAGALSYMSRPRESFEMQHEALRIRREIGDRTGEARTLALLAHCAVYVDRLSEGLRYAEESLAIRREVGDRHGEADALLQIARLYRKMDRPVEAITHAQQSLAIRREIGDRRGEAEALDNISRIHLKTGHVEAALDYAQQALRVEREIDDLIGQGWTLDHLADIHTAMGRHARAVQLCEQALRVREQIHDRHGQRRTLDHLAELHLAMNRPDKALHAARRALSIVREYTDPELLAPRLRVVEDLTRRARSPQARGEPEHPR